MSKSPISAIAAAAAALAMSPFAVNAAEAPAGSQGRALSASDTVHCYGVNDCAGTADCATTTHDCAGMNDCSGQGFLAITAGECLTRDGTIGDIR